MLTVLFSSQHLLKFSFLNERALLRILETNYNEGIAVQIELAFSRQSYTTNFPDYIDISEEQFWITSIQLKFYSVKMTRTVIIQKLMDDTTRQRHENAY